VSWASLALSIRSPANPSFWFVEKTSRDGSPAHTESGYLRFVDDDGGLEIVAALPTGQVELGTGLACTDGEDLVVTTDAEAHNSATAKQVSRIVRRFRLPASRQDHQKRPQGGQYSTGVDSQDVVVHAASDSNKAHD
jgi:hypothetical protein